MAKATAKTTPRRLRYEVGQELSSSYTRHWTGYFVWKPTYPVLCRCDTKYAAERIARAMNKLEGGDRG